MSGVRAADVEQDGNEQKFPVSVADKGCLLCGDEQHEEAEEEGAEYFTEEVHK